ncbi:MAG TPA: pyridoxamine 5'-phosphate oxidase family protein [Acidobacteriota bacterium]|nr:pyridoxamine 5'-phosphate oxidase family protein [Acidobacteriota bacterium]
MPINSPYHRGELEVQELAGEQAQARRNGGIVSDHIAAGALEFIRQQSLAVAATLDRAGYPWASLLLGPPGFMSAPDPSQIAIDFMQRPLAEDDVFFTNLAGDRRMGLLIIDLATRRRMRANGRLKRFAGNRLAMKVEEAYPNCPKYIERRHFRLGPPSGSAPKRRSGTRFDQARSDMIARSDTFFVASAYPGGGLDASHRGGPRGFVEVLEDNRLRIPDYTGNSLFNTLGNLLEHPQAGLAFLDFEGGRLLQLIGQARVAFEQPDPERRSGGTGRFWELQVERWVERSLTRQVEWEFLDSSPFNQRIADQTVTT